MLGFVLKCLDFVLEMIDFVFKMLDFIEKRWQMGGDHEAPPDDLEGKTLLVRFQGSFSTVAFTQSG